MNIKVQTGLVLAVCTLAGIAVGTLLVSGYQRIETQIHKLGPNSAAMRDVEQLKKMVGQWLMSADMVLKSSDVVSVSTAVRLADQLTALLTDIRGAPVASDQSEDLTRIQSDIRTIQALVAKADEPLPGDRQQKLQETSAQVDLLSEPLTQRVEKLKERMLRRSDYLAADLEDRRRVLFVLSWVAAAFYLGVVGLSWLWTIHKIVAPIEHLSKAAERAERDDAPFALDEHGPEEVKRLTRNISTFVAKLQSAKDRTEQEVKERTAELVKANRAKGEFLATMSHELRTPLNGIINMNELILDTRLDQEQVEFAKTAKTAAEALLALINDILDFSKIEAKKLELEQVELHLRDLVDGALEILGGVAEAKGLELHAIVEHAVPDALVGDPTRLRQVLINLLNNALKFTSSGSVSVRVRLVESGTADALVMFRVEDTGIGIPKDRIASLFKAFEQVDSSTTRKYGGTGLGLAICKELATLMNGSIGIESEPGAGSTFWFTARVGLANAPEQPVLADGAVVVLSARPLVGDRLIEQLRFLGLPPERVSVAPPATSVAAYADPKARHFWIVDPYGVDAAVVRGRLEELCSRGAPARIAVLEHWLRRWPKELLPLPAGCRRIAQPTRLAALLEWFGIAPTAQPRPQPAAAPQGTGRRGRILVAEDAPVNQRVIRTVLERAGFHPVLAEDGAAAVDAFARERFDLVLMDCQMPRMDGIEATRRIRALESERATAAPDQKPVPIVALTAFALEEVRERCFEAGMNEFLAKPFRPNALLALLDTLMPSSAQGAPQHPPAPPDVVPEAAPKRSVQNRGGGRRILVADDSPINQRVAQSVLGTAGYEVVVVDDGQKALDYLAEQHCELVLMDCQMPVLDGLEATRQIRARQRAGKLAKLLPEPLPVLALTGSADDSSRRQCEAAGMDGFLAKPFRPKELLEVVERTLASGSAT